MSDSLTMPSLLTSQYPAAQPRQQDFFLQQEALASRQAEITMTTAEGDRVTLSSSMENLTALQYNAAGKGQNASFVAATLSTSSYSMTVEGDLNPQELADIKSLIHDLSLIAKDFFKGNLDQAMNKAMNIGDTGTINGFAASFTTTSMTSSLLSDYHPLPALYPETMGSDTTDAAVATVAPAQPDLIDLLRGQWQQLKELLAQQTVPANGPLAKDQEITDAQDAAASPTATAQDILERTTTTIAAHPRLSPLVQPLVDQVIDNLLASVPEYEGAHGLANRLHNEFARAWHDWLTAA